MKNDPYPLFTHVSVTQIANYLQDDPLNVGRWMKRNGLRGPDYLPVPKAIEAGVAKLVTAPDGSQFWAWRKDVIQIMEKAGFGRRDDAAKCPPPSPAPQPLTPAPPAFPTPAAPPPTPPVAPVKPRPLIGPFTYRLNDGDGYVILNGNGEECLFGRGQQDALKVVDLFNIADAHGKFGP